MGAQSCKCSFASASVKCFVGDLLPHTPDSDVFVKYVVRCISLSKAVLGSVPFRTVLVCKKEVVLAKYHTVVVLQHVVME